MDSDCAGDDIPRVRMVSLIPYERAAKLLGITEPTPGNNSARVPLATLYRDPQAALSFVPPPMDHNATLIQAQENDNATASR